MYRIHVRLIALALVLGLAAPAASQIIMGHDALHDVKLWTQSYEGSGCANEFGAPPATADVTGSPNCDYVTRYTDGTEAMDIVQFFRSTPQWPIVNIHNYGSAVEFHNESDVYLAADFWLHNPGIYGSDRWMLHATNGAPATLLYPRFKSKTSWMAGRNIRVYCTASAFVSVSTIGKQNRWWRVFVDIDQGSGTSQAVVIYSWNGASWVQEVSDSCTSDQANPIKGILHGTIELQYLIAWRHDYIRISTDPLDKPGLDPVNP